MREVMNINGLYDMPSSVRLTIILRILPAIVSVLGPGIPQNPTAEQCEDLTAPNGARITSFLGFAATMFCCLGVNLFLSGPHSYATG